MSGASDDELRARIDARVKNVLGLAPVGLEALAAGLGNRRFFRATLDRGPARSLIVRVEPKTLPALPAGVAPEPPMEPIRQFLERSGLPVPARFDEDHVDGIALLEDLGDENLERAAAGAEPALRQHLYALAVDLIPRLQRLAAPIPAIPAFDRRLDSALIATKAVKWIQWAVPALLGRSASAAERRLVERAFAFIGAVSEAAPARLAHRDFKATNLHLRTRMDGAVELVMIDFQGAFLAPPEYDPVCLLRDSHVALPESEVLAHTERVREALPDAPSADEWARRFDLLTLARVAKDLAHYLDAANTHADPRYLAFVPTGLGNLRAAAARAAARDAELADLAQHIESIPADARGESTCAP